MSSRGALGTTWTVSTPTARVYPIASRPARPTNSDAGRMLNARKAKQLASRPRATVARSSWPPKPASANRPAADAAPIPVARPSTLPKPSAASVTTTMKQNANTTSSASTPVGPKRAPAITATAAAITVAAIVRRSARRGALHHHADGRERRRADGGDHGEGVGRRREREADQRSEGQERAGAAPDAATGRAAVPVPVPVGLPARGAPRDRPRPEHDGGDDRKDEEPAVLRADCQGASSEPERRAGNHQRMLRACVHRRPSAPARAPCGSSTTSAPAVSSSRAARAAP